MPKLEAWLPLGTIAPTALVEARSDLHWAAQLVSAPGSTLLPAAADASHTNLEWLPRSSLLAGHLIDGRRAALRFADLALVVLDGDEDVVVERSLIDASFAEALRWLADAFHTEKLSTPSH